MLGVKLVVGSCSMYKLKIYQVIALAEFKYFIAETVIAQNPTAFVKGICG